MNHSEIEYQPLARVVKGLTSIEDFSCDEIRAELISIGYDPDSIVARIEARVSALHDESRLSWMRQGDAMQARLDSLLHGLKSWSERSVSEVNQAFDDLLTGRNGIPAQLRVQSAFKNVTSLTTESKAAYLDEVATLLKLCESESKDSDKK